MADFPKSLEFAISGLVNTLVNKVMTRAGDADALEELVQVTGVPYVSDVTIRDYATRKAEEIWGPYMELPPPSSFDGAIEALRGAHQRLTNTGVTSIEDAELFSLGALVPDFMADFRSNQAGWRGRTIDAVRSGYLDRWGGMVFLQANTIALLWLVLRGYQEQVRQAQNDVVKLVELAEEVIAAYDPQSLCGSTESKNLTFNIAIGVLGVLSAGAGAAGMAVAGVVAAVGAAGLGVAKDMYEPDAPRDADIGGDSVAAIWQSILDATEKLRLQFSASERELHDIINGFHNRVVSGSILLGTSGAGVRQTVPALEAFRSKPLGVGVSNLERPRMGSDNPDPAHSPEY
ncbi:Na+-translocating ferredoxin:NAD+ oxidoreductase RnfG subunit [Actinoplanes campanulatus]|uniref:Na+-translocating ferredoxin:NAD+ oxidoreductase RnfG subunit n=1 Tax=Actinoplanes campanulatus TaxID=113559 RepID=A0A7W5FFT8_9ACTN|nr:hypothetical protein [Actinoplanes campanulatus]MBB3096836.1 Na+-translocating ferredoxin:NAD+ oxidoreductase RnfG subunit [Actinoplanes campanulatus]GGN44450.1 hypothetical protein GCM10010109_77690 [Actinoplanes campanulatus]GID37380.1 hypothetical protein Aca09nite_38860 [Actinoplanes campanulatus]